MKEEILKIIYSKICTIEEKNGFIVDTIDIVALKEVYNEILKTSPTEQ